MLDTIRITSGIKWYFLRVENWDFFDLVVREKGLEPLHRRRQNLNLVRLPISPLPHIESFQMGWLKGLEPLTTGITIRDSTNWAIATIGNIAKSIQWRVLEESNLWPTA